MNKELKMKLSCVCAACFALLPLSASVLTNEDFFQRNHRDEPTGWQIRYSIPEMAKKNFVSASEGVLTLGGEGFRGELLLIQPNIALKPHTSYRISFESRSVEKSGNLRVYLQFQKLVDGQAVSETVNDSWKTISPEWAEHEFTIDFPENGRSPWFVINTTGNVSTQIRRLTIKAVEQQETK